MCDFNCVPDTVIVVNEEIKHVIMLQINDFSKKEKLKSH